MKPTVVILLSDKRSGSTMFQSELCKHSDIRHVDYSPHTYFETHHWLKAACILDMAPELFSGGKVYNGYGGKKNARIYMEDCIKKNVPNFIIPADNRELVFSGWNALCRKYACPVFFEKSPQILAHKSALELLLEWIKHTDYKVKIIGLIRNPMSVMYSAEKLFHTNPEERQYGWVEIYENLLEFQANISHDDFMLCKYEDIIENPVSKFEEVCKFIGVSVNPDVGTGVHAGSKCKWVEDMGFALQLDASVKEVAYCFGYSDAELENPEKSRLSMFYRCKRSLKENVRIWYARLKDRIITPHNLKKNS